MSVAFSLDKARQAVVLVMSALTSRTAGYGPVCPVVWEGHPVRGVPIPIMFFTFYLYVFFRINQIVTCIYFYIYVVL